MGISDPVMNCVLAVCCAPNSDSQTETLARVLVDECECPRAVAPTVAKRLLAYFEFAPAGTLADFKAVIAKVARDTPNKG